MGRAAFFWGKGAMINYKYSIILNGGFAPIWFYGSQFKIRVAVSAQKSSCRINDCFTATLSSTTPKNTN